MTEHRDSLDHWRSDYQPNKQIPSKAYAEIQKIADSTMSKSVQKELASYELTDDELLDAAAPRGKLFTIYQRDQCRRVANKAVEKAYEQGQKELAREVMGWLGAQDNTWGKMVVMDARHWLQEKGLL